MGQCCTVELHDDDDVLQARIGRRKSSSGEGPTNRARNRGDKRGGDSSLAATDRSSMTGRCGSLSEGYNDVETYDCVGTVGTGDRSSASSTFSATQSSTLSAIISSPMLIYHPNALHQHQHHGHQAHRRDDDSRGGGHHLPGSTTAAAAAGNKKSISITAPPQKLPSQNSSSNRGSSSSGKSRSSAIYSSAEEGNNHERSTEEAAKSSLPEIPSMGDCTPLHHNNSTSENDDRKVVEVERTTSRFHLSGSHTNQTPPGEQEHTDEAPSEATVDRRVAVPNPLAEVYSSLAASDVGSFTQTNNSLSFTSPGASTTPANNNRPTSFQRVHRKVSARNAIKRDDDEDHDEIESVVLRDAMEEEDKQQKNTHMTKENHTDQHDEAPVVVVRYNNRNHHHHHQGTDSVSNQTTTGTNAAAAYDFGSSLNSSTCPSAIVSMVVLPSDVDEALHDEPQHQYRHASSAASVAVVTTRLPSGHEGGGDFWPACEAESGGKEEVEDDLRYREEKEEEWSEASEDDLAELEEQQAEAVELLVRATRECETCIKHREHSDFFQYQPSATPFERPDKYLLFATSDGRKSEEQREGNHHRMIFGTHWSLAKQLEKDEGAHLP